MVKDVKIAKMINCEKMVISSVVKIEDKKIRCLDVTQRS